MRCAVIEIGGNLIYDLVEQEQTETTKGQIDSLFDLLEERVLDVNPYCRSKLFQVYIRVLRFVPVSGLGSNSVCLQNFLRDDSVSVNCASEAWKIRAVTLEET